MPWSHEVEVPTGLFGASLLRLTRESIFFDDRALAIHEITSVTSLSEGDRKAGEHGILLGTERDPQSFLIGPVSGGARAREAWQEAFDTLLQLLDETAGRRIVRRAVSGQLPQVWGGYTLEEAGVSHRSPRGPIFVPWPRVTGVRSTISSLRLDYRDASGEQASLGALRLDAPNARYFDKVIDGLRDRFAPDPGTTASTI